MLAMGKSVDAVVRSIIDIGVYRVTLKPAASVTFTTGPKFAPVVGVPEIVPVEPFSVSPYGRVPDEIAQE